ncbi:hypothetical protein HOA92_04290 [archaeon]|jgi:hypothetical protein|nr:hypothetical protein [archaeon]MBT6762234.1 hypothetical protein [archaeon]
MVGTKIMPEADGFASSSKDWFGSSIFGSKLFQLSLLFLVIFSLFSISVLADTEGCYLFTGGSEDYLCQDNVLESDAEADCDLYGADCDFDSKFIAGASCSDYPEVCEEVTCSVDCDSHSIGKCEDLGGVEVTDPEYDLWCSEGCCSVGSFCEYVDLRYDCVDRALQQGYTESDIYMEIGDTDPVSCQTDICGITLSSGTVGGYILDGTTGLAISGATIEISSSVSDTSSSDGYFFFADVTPNSYVLQVSASGYSSTSSTVSIGSGESLEVNFSLAEAGESFTIGGIIHDNTGLEVSDVSICFESSAGDESCTVSDSVGVYGVFDLQASDYTITMTKYGYSTTTDSLSVSADATHNLVINSIDFQGVSGITLLDENGNGLYDSSTEDVIYGASIYVDGVYQGNSQYSGGDYEVYLEEGDYVIHATYQDYASGEYDIAVTSGVTVDLDLLLEKEIGECSYGEENDQKAVEIFDGVTSQGDPEITLSWAKPCAEVSGYIIEKEGEVFGESFSPLAITTVDTDVEWGETYTYSIVAVYTDGPLDEPRFSESATEVTVTLGSFNCEGREVGDTFCVVGDTSSGSDERKSVYTCNENNDILVSSDCSSLDNEDSSFFCSSASDSYALCKDAGSCSILGQAAEPFGLYYSSESCYGGLDSSDGYESFCYYDHAESSIVDACYSCEEVTNCFDYIGQESCEINNCLGVGCSWIDSSNTSLDYGITGSEGFLDSGYLFPSTLETGHGYCAPDEYGEDEETGFNDYCGLCGPEADLFENSYCTADVCSNLGRCFADTELTACDTCGDIASSEANCYAYNSELECTGGDAISITTGTVSGSADSCSWNKCSWQTLSTDDESGDSAVNGYCYKDGNADTIDDCSEFSSGEYTACIKDVYAPVTSLDVEYFAIVSTTFSNITFLGVDEANPMGQLGYCLASSETSDCTDFEYVDYNGLEPSEELIVDIVASSFLESSEIDGVSYVLRYFSLDKYLNQESVHETIVFIDNHLPEYTVEWESSVDGDISELIVYLGDLNEAMSCDFGLTEVYPAGDIFESSVGRDEDKDASFSDLDGIIYNLTVACRDDYGNIGEYDEEIVFDLEQDITLVYPEYDGVVAETSIEFAITTLVSASCELYDVESGAKVADFSSLDDANKEHKTEPVGGFYEGNYAGTVKAVCVESLDGDVLEDYFYFKVDFTAPETQIVLTEGERTEEPNGFGWEEYFVETVQVDFSCVEDDGFTCANTYYCLGDGCEYASAGGYIEYTESVELVESTEICYYSIDEAGSVGYPDCGEILIEGFGIILVSPTQYVYEGETWGISNIATFDWELMTKIDTNACAFDFNSGFDMTAQPEYKQISSSDVGDNYYLYSSFPGDVLESFDKGGSIKTLYVACQDYLGEVGPDQKMNLEYDPSAPEINDAFAEPDSLSEGVETYLFTTTDDKTLCKFSDNSEGSGSSEFDTMEYSFPGFELDEGKQELFIDHDTSFGFSFSGASKDYLLNVQCMNGAGDLSAVEEIDFSVDYSISGYIASTSPNGYISDTDVTLEVVTSKNAECSYDEIVMESTGGTTHTQYLGVLEEGEYQYLIVCSIEGSDREGEAAFIIDLTAPTVTEVDDGSYSCSLDTVSLLVYSDEDAISSFYYELYETGDVVGVDENDSTNVSDLDSSSGTLISSGSMPATEGTNISGLSLVENGSYYFSVSVTDEAGNSGAALSSNGFVAVPSDSVNCASDEVAPEITISTEGSCSGEAATITCSDDLGCSSVLYGFASDSSSCVADSTYYGSAINFESSGWVCYIAEDVNGNNLTGSVKVTVTDDDGDGVLNSCDVCSSTTAGSAVDLDGCGYGQDPDTDDGDTTDTDNDGLPDSWENLYDEISCPLNYANSDSDSDGVLDTNEDYDDDGYTNYEEYRAGYDPCVFDGRTVDPGTDPDPIIDDDPIDPNEEKSLLGLVFLLAGLLLISGGAGGLYYAYAKDPNGKAAVAQFFGAGVGSLGGQIATTNGYRRPTRSRRSSRQINTGELQGQPAKNSWMQNLRSSVAGLGRAKQKKSRRKERSGIFAGFSSRTQGFPHFDDVLGSRKKPMAKLGDLTSRYAEHKETVNKGLKSHEKDLFAKLDTITERAKTHPLTEVSSPKEAKDIFKKLKELSDKRK